MSAFRSLPGAKRTCEFKPDGPIKAGLDWMREAADSAEPKASTPTSLEAIRRLVELGLKAKRS
jgi:hypothetical protein